MTTNPSKLLRITRIYLDRYTAIPEAADQAALLALADDYDAAFLEQAVPFIEKQLTIINGLWQPSDTAAVAVGDYVQNLCASIIVDGVSRWLTDDGENQDGRPRVEDYFRRGLDLWSLNMELLGKRPPRKIKLTPEEIDTISGYLNEFHGTWRDHLDRHVRAVRRFVFVGTQRGWTTERFIEAMTAPDGHIIGFRYGNADYSWREHLRRFGIGKMRMLAQVAQQGRV